MTVIAWDGKTLAADRQFSVSDIVFAAQKIFKLPNGKVVAMCGYADEGLQLLGWARKGEKPEDFPTGLNGDKITFVVVDPLRGLLYEYESRPIPLYRDWNKIAAWGSGQAVALGALAHGATAREAVKTANRFNVWCGEGCTSFTVR